jgi:hypothetical protein
MTITLDVQDNYFLEVLKQLNTLKDKFHFEIKDKNLELDPYFYERQKELHQIRDDIESGKMELISHEEFWKEFE